MHFISRSEVYKIFDYSFYSYSKQNKKPNYHQLGFVPTENKPSPIGNAVSLTYCIHENIRNSIYFVLSKT